MNRTRLADSPGRRLGLALCAGLCLALGACDGESDTAVAIRDAESRLRALTPAGAQPVSVDYRKRVYTDIRGKLQPTLASGTRAENASAAVLLAHTAAGLAQIPAEEASGLAEDMLHDGAELRAVLSRWLTHTGMAQAAAKFDPGPELAGIDGESRKADEGLAASQQRKAEVDRRVADLRAQAAKKTDESRALRQKSGALRARIPNETAVQGAALLEEARGIGRQADALEVEGANLEAQAAQIAPQSGEIQLQIDNLNLQKQMLAQSRASVQKRGADARTQEAEARRDAEKVGADLAGRIKAMEEKQAQVTALAGEATTGFAGAAATAGKASQELKTTAQMAVGSALQSAGDAWWTLSQSHASLAETLDLAAKASFNSAELTGKAAAAMEAAKAALQETTQAYQGAYDAYEAAGAKAEAAEVMERLKARLGATLKTVSGGAIDLGTPAPAEGTPPAAPAEAGAVARGAGAETPQALIEQGLAAFKAKNFRRLAELTHAENEADRKLLVDAAAVVAKMQALDEAIKSRFPGATFPGMEALSVGGPSTEHFNADPADVKIEEQGDRATATFPGGTTEELVKINGGWLMTMKPDETEQLRQAAPMLNAMGGSIDEIIADINAGKYATADEAMMAIGQKLMGAMGGMPGGPGGGR
ncbi:MAG: hypothetical protein WD749_05680 [Phycisphaerales bacterium]